MNCLPWLLFSLGRFVRRSGARPKRRRRLRAVPPTGSHASAKEWPASGMSTPTALDANCPHAEVEPGAELYDDSMGTAQNDESRSMEEGAAAAAAVGAGVEGEEASAHSAPLQVPMEARRAASTLALVKDPHTRKRDASSMQEPGPQVRRTYMHMTRLYPTRLD